MTPTRLGRFGIALLALLAALSLPCPASGQVPPASPPQEAAGEKAAPEQKKPDLPLVAARKLEFDTDEGTWLSLDVTPDGKSVVFDLLGDLYAVPLAGGPASRVTEGLAFDAQPRVSPDGKWVAFVSDRSGADNLWIARPDGTGARRLSDERQQAVISPAWTPDSQYVVVSVRSQRGAELRLYHVNGGSGITLGKPGSASTDLAPGDDEAPSPPTPALLGAVVAPDGRSLYVAQSTNAARGMLPRWQIARMDMQTGDLDVITQAEGSAMRPVLSTDGRLLVYATRHETKTGLRIRNLVTGADRWLVWPLTRDEQESGAAPSRDTFPGYAFTPDGREVVVTVDGKIARVDVDTGALTPVPFTVHVALDIGPTLDFPYRIEQGPVRARLVQDTRVSPDGRRVAFSVLTKLYVMEVAGGTPRRLTGSEEWEFKPAWSPDGQWIAFVTWSTHGGHVWRTRADGQGPPQQLTEHAAFYTDLAYSPDGTRIVALRGNEYMRQQTFSEFGGLRIPLDLVWLPAEGGPVTLVAPARGLGAPHFASEPDRIYVYSSDGLTSLRYDGTDRRTHLKVTGPARSGAPKPQPAESVLMRPDGKWALAEVNNQLWLVAVPPYTGQAAQVNVRTPSVPAKQLTDIGADYFTWADGGRTVTWAIGSTIYRRAFDTFDFTPPPIDKDAKAAEGASGQPGGSPQAGAPEAKRAEPLDTDKNVEATTVAIDLPRATPSGTVVLRHATAITMKGDEIIRDADIVVIDNRIAAIGRRGTVRVPADARRIDLAGTFVVPGFVDTHAHWEFRTHDVLEPQNWSLVANLAYGVTTGLDVQTSTNDYFAYSDLVETGQTVGERAFMTGPGIFSNNDFQSYEATLGFVRRYAQHYRTHNIKSYMVGNRKQRQWVAMAARELQVMPTTEGGSDMKLDLTHAIDGMHGNEHTLPVMPLYKDVVELFARTQTAYTPTLLVQYGGPIAEEHFYTTTEVHDDTKLNRFYPHNVLDDMTRRRQIWVRSDEFSFPQAAAQAAKIQRAGGLVGVGGHGQLQGLGYHWEMWAMALGGMTPREVMKAATIDGARVIGVAQDVGTLEVGKLADLVVLRKDPLDDIRNTNTVRYVMKNGELFDGDTLDQVWPAQTPLAPFWWWNSQPRDRTRGTVSAPPSAGGAPRY